MFHSSVQFIWHVSQINEGIYVDGATRTATAKVTPFTSQHASELNARLIQHRGGRRNPPSPNVSCAFRPWPLLAGAHTLAKPHIPEEALITNSAPPTRWPLIISVYSSPSEQPLLHLSYASRCRLHRCPASKRSYIRPLTAVRQSASRNLSLTWSASGDRASHGPAACTRVRLPSFPNGL